MPLLRRSPGGTPYGMQEKGFAIGDDFWVETAAGRRAQTRSLRPLICGVFGHRLPRRHRPFFLTEQYQQCERCEAQVPLERTSHHD